ncbi:MAG: hypothetical protein JF612_06570 [Planctomycetia bacterium]|nr:hypothetical protein [Planctomycetia bacterium]
MRHVVYAVACFLAAIGSSAGAESHHVLVLDAGQHRGADNHRLMLLEMESGKVLANVELGSPTNLGLSNDGSMVGVLTTVGSGAERETRLNFYRAGDLSLVQSGKFPKGIWPGNRQSGVATNLRFSPDCKEITFCGLATHGNVDFAVAAIVRLTRELDDQGAYRWVTAATIELCRGVDFVSVAKWPQVVVLNQTLSELLTIDLDRGNTIHRLIVAEPGPYSLMPMRLRGVCLSDDGQTAYFLPRKTGLLKKIELRGDPRVTIARGPDESNVRDSIAVVSERAERLFVLDDRRNPAGAYQPARSLKAFGTGDLRFQCEIEVPLADCHWLAASRDGKYLYAAGPLAGPPFDELSITQSRLAVIDASSGREVKILEAGQRPAVVFPVAEQ